MRQWLWDALCALHQFGRGLQALKEVTEDGLFFYLFGTLSLGEHTYSEISLLFVHIICICFGGGIVFVKHGGFV